MSYMIETYLMRGHLQEKSVYKMLFGFESLVAPNVNGGNFLDGNDLALSPNITPVFND